MGDCRRDASVSVADVEAGLSRHRENGGIKPPLRDRAELAVQVSNLHHHDLERDKLSLQVGTGNSDAVEFEVRENGLCRSPGVAQTCRLWACLRLVDSGRLHPDRMRRDVGATRVRRLVRSKRLKIVGTNSKSYCKDRG